MSRPNKTPGAIFSYEELRLAGDFSRREIAILLEAGNLVPPGRGERAFKRLAAIGVFDALGYPLLASARIVRALLEHDHHTQDGEYPTGFRFQVQRLPAEIARTIPNDATDYDYHGALYGSTAYYEIGVRWPDDCIYEILDGRTVVTYSPKLSRPDVIGQLTRVGRGDAVEFTPRRERPSNEGIARRRDNASTRAILNLSIGIRAAYDRVHDYRIRNGTPTARPPGQGLT